MAESAASRRGLISSRGVSSIARVHQLREAAQPSRGADSPPSERSGGISAGIGGEKQSTPVGSTAQTTTAAQGPRLRFVGTDLSYAPALIADLIFVATLSGADNPGLAAETALAHCPF